MTAVKRATEMLYIPACELPPSALALRDKMWRERWECASRLPSRRSPAMPRQ